MKSIFCPHCGRLLEQGEVQEYLDCTEINNVMLRESNGKNELDRDNHDALYGDEVRYFCADCEKELEGYEYDDIVAIFLRIESFERVVKSGNEITTDNEECSAEFNKYLKYIEDEKQ